MVLIPVIDLMAGQVVRGMQGLRSTYRPIESALCRSSEPVAVAQRLVDHCAAPALYVADLDALTGGAVQVETLGRLLAALPGTRLWLDAGFTDAAAAQAVLARSGDGADRVVPVFGSESLASRAALEGCTAAFGRDGCVLSLDRRGGERLDVAGCWDAPALWPQRVIVMTLERVGSDAGPDLETLADVRCRAPGIALVGAGGVRTPADLEAADAAGASAWLVASAIHDLRLPRAAR